MTDDTDPVVQGGSVDRLLAGRLGRLPTGLKMFGLLSLALLPLGIIIFFASLQSTRIADLERRAAVRIALSESARRLGSEIAIDVGTLRAASAALDAGRPAPDICARTRGILSTAVGAPTDFALVDGAGRTICATIGVSVAASPLLDDRPRMSSVIDTDRGRLRVEVVSGKFGHAGIAVYSTPQLAATARSAEFDREYRLELGEGAKAITLVDSLKAGNLQRIEALTIAVPRTSLALTMSVRSVPLTASQVLTMLLPLLMWAAAAAIGWFVVDRLILRPLTDLRAAVAAYRPGMIFGGGKSLASPAREIGELSDTFRAITETVAAHESDLALGLSRQTKLTREVHHRVKNNLQVIASLINLHARGAKSPEAIAAYGSIQRRVDALSVVHRNHFAELEENRGVGVRALIGEIAANLRATAPPEAAGLQIAIESAPYYVTQDVAVPLAFIITELVELAMLVDPKTTVHIAVNESNPERSRLVIQSAALIDGRALRNRMADRHGRVLEGLARQLRSHLEIDQAHGRYSVEFTHAGVE